MSILNTLEAATTTITTYPWVVTTTLSTCRMLTTPLCHTILRIGRFSDEIFTIEVLFFLQDDGSGPFCFFLKEYLLTFSFCFLDSLHDVLALFLLVNSFLSLNLSSWTYCTFMSRLDMYISPINIDIFPSLLDRPDNLTTNIHHNGYKCYYPTGERFLFWDMLFFDKMYLANVFSNVDLSAKFVPL